MANRINLFVSIICCIAMGCAQEAPKTTVTTPATPAKPVVMEPFRFHKLVEVSPGDDFDILSWGRGSSETGSFEILHSDSADMKYTTTTSDLEGTIVDAYNSDMDLDGNPEILIQAKAKDTSNYAVIYAFEFNNSKANKLDFPKLTKSQRLGYRGGDNFYIQDGKFMRQFPIYDGDGKNAKPTGAKRLLQYGLRNNEFTVQQLSTDSTLKKNTISPKNIVAKKDSTSTNKSSKKSSNNSSSSSSKKKKKHKNEEHTSSHKKKKRHHHSD